ncbi:MAG: hypothetical protein LUO93_05980 [Methanomicrobiales archaeon]|nr:hypothetical protein [Methanomicrobiales archaeon]
MPVIYIDGKRTYFTWRRPQALFPYRMTVFDVDGVLCDFVTGVRDVMSGHGYTLPEVATSWDWFESVIPADEFWKIVKSTEDFWYHLPPYKFTLRDIVALRALEAHHRICFATVRVPTAGRPVAVQTEDWIKEHLGIENPLVVTVKDHGVVPHLFLGEAYLNDNLDQTIKVALSRGYGVHLLNQPWNQDKEKRELLLYLRGHIVDSIAEFVDHVLGNEGARTRNQIVTRRTYMFPWDVVDAATKFELPQFDDPRRARSGDYPTTKGGVDRVREGRRLRRVPKSGW